MRQVDSILDAVVFGLVTGVLLAAPWLFGAWEPWWFWPFTVCIFLATAGFSVRLLFSARLGVRRLAFTPATATVIAAYLPFLAYALIRAIQADVPMDAERSFLLHLTPFLLGVIILVSFTEPQGAMLSRLLAFNFLLLALYGILNHVYGRNANVLWAPGFKQYQEGYYRATGSYFCPDHFAGLMEMGASMALALIWTRSTSFRLRMAAGVLALVACAGIVLSKSRGAGLVTTVVLLASLWLGTRSWPVRTRTFARLGGCALLLAAIGGFALLGGHYVQRFKEYPWRQLESSDRFQMSAAALRGWQSAPFLGIGPGMHQNLWPHFAPSPDGDRARGIWPSHPNNTYHSYEAHNDWAQLLEEYGLVGLLLFLLATGTVGAVLFNDWRRRAQALARGDPAAMQPGQPHWIILAALMALTAMTVHSAGDFNLQIPASTWLLAGLTGLALSHAANRDIPADPSRRRRRPHGQD
jgi:O-antigen ligase